MKQEYFNIDDNDYLYDNIDRLSEKDLENLTGDNLFLAFLKENNQTNLNCLSSIDGRIYNFNTHKFINDNAEILFAKAFSDIMPSTIWRLVYIINYDLITIDIDDNKSYLIEHFEDFYKGKVEEGAKEKILRNGYITPKFRKIANLNRTSLKNINGSNIFLALLETVNKETNGYSAYYQQDQELVNITYNGIELCANILKDMVECGNVILPSTMNLEDYIAMFKRQALKELDKYWYIKRNTNAVTANFIGSINGHIYNFCTNEYIDFSKTKINYAESLDKILPENKWKLSYSKSGSLVCITIDESVVDILADFQAENSEIIDKEAKTKVLRNGYKIQS